MAVAPRTNPSQARERVLNAAYTLFVQGGFADVSMQQIAEEASITKATLYHHFRDKQDLYIETMRMAFTRHYGTLMELFTTSEDVEEIIHSFFAIAFSRERTDLMRLDADFKQYIDPEARHAFWQQFRKPWFMMEDALQAAMDRGEIPAGDVPMLARFIVGTAAGMGHICRAEREELGDWPGLADDATRVVMRAIRPSDWARE